MRRAHEALRGRRKVGLFTTKEVLFSQYMASNLLNVVAESKGINDF